MFSENLDVLLKDFGETWTVGAQSLTGLLDQPDEQMLMAGVNVMSTMYALTVKASDVAALSIKSGTVIAKGAVNHVVRDVMLVDDGAFAKLTLSKV